MKILFILCVLSFQAVSAASQYFDTKNGLFITQEELFNSIPKTAIFVLGEYHNDETIQNEQAAFIKSHIKTNDIGSFGIFWEFLNHLDQRKINFLQLKMRAGMISSKELIQKIFGEQNQSYAPIIDLINKQYGHLFGINIPRKIKQQVIKEGLGSIDQDLIPPHHYTGDENYLARFTMAMGGHVPADMVEKYFLAQCLTDSIMADQIAENHHRTSYVIAGSFHTDFYNGTVARLRPLTGSEVITFKFVNMSKTDSNEQEKLKNGDEAYGHYADYIVFAK